MSTWNTQRLPTGIFLVIFAALYSIVQIPVYLTVVPPLLDYPNHLARMHILLNIPHSEVLQSFYEIQWAVIPNLAMDLIVPWLGIFVFSFALYRNSHVLGEGEYSWLLCR
jgi:hypothetical protein